MYAMFPAWTPRDQRTPRRPWHWAHVDRRHRHLQTNSRQPRILWPERSLWWFRV